MPVAYIPRRLGGATEHALRGGFRGRTLPLYGSVCATQSGRTGGVRVVAGGFLALLRTEQGTLYDAVPYELVPDQAAGKWTAQVPRLGARAVSMRQGTLKEGRLRSITITRDRGMS